MIKNSIGVLTIIAGYNMYIKIQDDETVKYKFTGDKRWSKATIEYETDCGDILGFDDDEMMHPCFKTSYGARYFIGEFIKQEVIK